MIRPGRLVAKVFRRYSLDQTSACIWAAGRRGAIRQKTLLARETGLDVNQGGQLAVVFPGTDAAVEITTGWTDACDVAIFRLDDGGGAEGSDSSLEKEDIALTIDEASDLITVQRKRMEGGQDLGAGGEEKGGESYLVQANVPHLFSVSTRTRSGGFTLVNKLKGDCRVLADSGDIKVDVVRGENINLLTKAGRVQAKELEGNVDIAATQVDVDVINGANVQIEGLDGHDATDADTAAAGINIGGLYSTQAAITAAGGGVHVSTAQGTVNVEVADEAVTLGSVSGAATVSTGDGDINVGFQIVEPGKHSDMRSSGGNITASVSNDVKAKLVLSGKIDTLGAFQEAATEGSPGAGGKRDVHVDVTVVGQQHTAPAHDDTAAIGKIDRQGAKEQSLRAFFESTGIDGVEGGGGERGTNSASSSINICAEKGFISLGRLDWADAIRARYGMA